MKPALIVYATREGHTQRLAGHMSESLLRRGVFVEIGDAARLSDEFHLGGSYGSVILVASVHGGRHEREMVRFVKRHRAVLELLPTAFLSVSLSQAAAELAENTPAKRERAALKVEAALDQFREDTVWTPTWTLAVAGALPYRRFKRPPQWVMRSIARSHGLPDDASRDYTWTDWAALDQFIDTFAARLRTSKAQSLDTSAHV